MIEQKPRDYSIIVYSSPDTPKYFKVNKSLLKFFLIVAPTFIITFFLGLLVHNFYLNKEMNVLKGQSLSGTDPNSAIIAKYSSEITDLKKTVKELEKKNQAKISEAGGGGTADSALLLFNLPLGFINKTNQTELKMENTRWVREGSEAHLKFDLLSSGPKISGYITILEFSPNRMQIYPAIPSSLVDGHLYYNNGESFTVARFRPVDAKFPFFPASQNSIYKILIFSRTGDLLISTQIKAGELR